MVLGAVLKCVLKLWLSSISHAWGADSSGFIPEFTQESPQLRAWIASGKAAQQCLGRHRAQRLRAFGCNLRSHAGITWVVECWVFEHWHGPMWCRCSGDAFCLAEAVTEELFDVGIQMCSTRSQPWWLMQDEEHWNILKCFFLCQEWSSTSTAYMH